MTPSLATIRGPRGRDWAVRSWDGVDAPSGTRAWYWNASGGFLLERRDAWNPPLASLVFPSVTSSSGIDRRAVGRFVGRSQHFSALPIARQVRQLRAALSINKSELARILRVSRPTVYDWLDGGEPNAGNVSRIRTLLRFLSEARVSASNPLFPRFVRFPLEPGGRALLDLLREETIDEATVRNAVRGAKALGAASTTARSAPASPPSTPA